MRKTLSLDSLSTSASVSVASHSGPVTAEKYENSRRRTRILIFLIGHAAPYRIDSWSSKCLANDRALSLQMFLPSASSCLSMITPVSARESCGLRSRRSICSLREISPGDLRSSYAARHVKRSMRPPSGLYLSSLKSDCGSVLVTVVEKSSVSKGKTWTLSTKA